MNRNTEIAKKMVAASEVMSSDLSRLTTSFDGESNESLSGAELYSWLYKEVSIEFRYHAVLPVLNA